MCAQVDPNNTDSNGCQSCLLVVNRHIEQWGKIDGNNARWYYPIIFKTLFYAQVAGDREEVDVPNATKVSMLTFAGNKFLSFYTDYVGGTNRFIVIGVQQWGLSKANEGTRIVTLPIPFSLACYSIVATYNADAEAGSYTYPLKIKSYSTSNFTAYVNPAKCFWIATGI